jgi:hypothetical protein
MIVPSRDGDTSNDADSASGCDPKKTARSQTTSVIGPASASDAPSAFPFAQHPDACMLQRPAIFRRHQQRLYRRLLFLALLFRLGQRQDVRRRVFQHYELRALRFIRGRWKGANT